MSWQWTFPGVLKAGPELKTQPGNLFRLREDGIDRFVRDPFIGRLVVPSFDALQILFEALREAKRLSAGLGHVRNDAARRLLSTGPN